MTVGELKELLKDVPDDYDLYRYCGHTLSDCWSIEFVIDKHQEIVEIKDL